MEGRIRRGCKYNRNKKQADNCQRPSGMEEDYFGSHSPQQTVVSEKKRRRRREERERRKGRKRRNFMKTNAYGLQLFPEESSSSPRLVNGAVNSNFIFRQ
jgi:hypothetical protein